MVAHQRLVCHGPYRRHGECRCCWSLSLYQLISAASTIDTADITLSTTMSCSLVVKFAEMEIYRPARRYCTEMMVGSVVGIPLMHKQLVSSLLFSMKLCSVCSLLRLAGKGSNWKGLGRCAHTFGFWPPWRPPLQHLP